MAKAEQLKIGVKVQLSDGSTAEVIAEAVGAEVKLRFIDSPFEPELKGTEGVRSVDDITSWYPGEDLRHTQGVIA